ncbi:beta-ketoacyl-ACP synthase III [Mangrovibacterium diazotrophicum]|uniref:3-oxoacyl-[acyl-carrier-protein] synthase-3 n=1 Tax=Mangrovibacterium diazotrophicum TaxID=1261403 RepID=A0A419W606_9BACT|nr:beta-ketoacyl-ACP synthase III [Mangrovibacterium diazotrophicum]RKD90850.1 3-oxoacyl-[acyl-carrier-protein] synthase-3 [Mangrovibacterium diazotrophicum]
MYPPVYITSSSKFLPNAPVCNEDMERYLGLVNGKPSRVRRIVLKQNGIKCRYYALNKNQQTTHTNAELALESIKGLFPDGKIQSDIDVLACATGNPDQLLPSHASMVHGLMKNRPMEIYSSAGVCLTCLQALKLAYMSILSGQAHKAICSTSELASPTLLSKNYEEEYEYCTKVGTDPYMAFEKDFLRFMLSDGASAVLLSDKKNENGLSLKVEWIEMTSYANELPTCMFMGAELRNDGELKSWKEFESQELINRSVFTVKQDIRLLKPNIIRYWVDHIEECLQKHNVDSSEINYVIPHVSSMFFYGKLAEEIEARNLDLGTGKWFTNLTEIGNIASASIFAALDDLLQAGQLKINDKILLLVPESGRFSYGTALLTVVY